MALQTTTQIFIESNQILSYVSLQLEQQIDEHHHLELVCRADVVDKITTELIGESKEFLGKTIILKISAIEVIGGYKELEFKGIVTKVKGTKAFNQPKGNLVTIYAKSTSILTDHSPHFDSFLDMNLSDILSKTFQEYDASKLNTDFSPTSTDTLHYIVQHNQSAFDFASRLASYYNQWFYYDGKKLVFGKPSTDETKLTYGTDLQEFSLELHPLPNNYTYFTQDYLTDKQHKKSSTSVVEVGNNDYQKLVNLKSDEMYIKETQIFHSLYTDAQMASRFDKQITAHTQSIEVNQVIAKGTSDNPGVNLGEIIRIAEYGSYRIIKIKHSNDEGGRYHNQFEAIPALDIYPLVDIHRFPKSEAQIAVVTDNNDPERLGRIKVQFPWQKLNGGTTPWVRVITPYAGADKGFHFIPEIGEQVIVDFEYGNAECPYVKGALYQGNAKPDSWGTAKNDIKAIRTRSGHTIELNDTQKGEFITIVDVNGNSIKLDTVGKTITIDAPEHVFINSKNISLKASENINIESGENYRLQTKELKEQVTGNAQVQVDNNAKEISKTFERQIETITVKASSKVDIQTPDFNHGT